jgi:hypothetical protein
MRKRQTRIIDKNKSLANCAAKGKKLSEKQKKLLKANPRELRKGKFL